MKPRTRQAPPARPTLAPPPSELITGNKLSVPAAPPAAVRLTPRESQVLDGIVRGLMDKEVAAELQLSHSRVRKIAGALFRKYQVPSRVCLVLAELQRTGALATK